MLIIKQEDLLAAYYKEKTALWSGSNKEKVRQIKLEKLKEAFSDGTLEIENTPLMLSFPGAQARFEKLVIEEGLLEPWQITAIQTAGLKGEHLGQPYLHNLIKIRNEELPGMPIWPWEFDIFCKNYKDGRLKPPVFQDAAWAKDGLARAEMENITNIDTDNFPSATAPFDILDLDLCGVFTRGLLKSLEELIEPPSHIAEKGVLFLTQQKGREAGYWFFPFLREYFSAGELLDFTEDGFTTSLAGHPNFNLARTFANKGYTLDIEHLVEYADKNEGTTGGNYMLQWICSFRYTGIISDARMKELENVILSNWSKESGLLLDEINISKGYKYTKLKR
jgi:hypothetical protein